MLQGTITVQSTSTIMQWVSSAGLSSCHWYIVPPPPTSLASVIRTISPLGRGTPTQLEEAIFFFNYWNHSSSLAVHLQAVVFLISSVRGAEE